MNQLTVSEPALKKQQPGTSPIDQTEKIMNKPIYVTQPFLPPLEELQPYLEKIWSNKILTNGGPFHQQLEAELCKYLGINYISLFSNGTLALITALQALRVTGEVITTPFSFVATAHSLLWHGNKPVFVDIEPDNLNLDPMKIESAITPQTTAIMPVHCYGHPCDVDAIQRIADNYNLRVIYDACHTFGVEDSGGSVLRHGDLSCISFHATKVFNTFEGGAIICKDEKTKIRIDQLKNFGHVGETTVVAPGINGKMSEFNAAVGLIQLKHIDRAIDLRSQVDSTYRSRLQGLPGIRCIQQSTQKRSNFSYFPILVEKSFRMTRDQLNEILKENGVFPRRYFYPLISEFSMYRSLPSAAPGNLPVASEMTRKILCLPIYPDLQIDDVNRICDLIEG
jgi:dTDP-4-amino-4,6-dideoxygalactose transaminase